MWFTRGTAAGRCLCTGRLEQPEKLQPDRVGWLCSPNKQINKTTHKDRIKTLFFLKKCTKTFNLPHYQMKFGSLFLGKPVANVTWVVAGSKNKTTPFGSYKREKLLLPASISSLVEYIKINYADFVVEPWKNIFDGEF